MYKKNLILGVTLLNFASTLWASDGECIEINFDEKDAYESNLLTEELEKKAKRDLNKGLALIAAAAQNNTAWVKYLLHNGADRYVNYQDASGRTALMFAAMHGNVECVTCLLTSDSLVKIKDDEGDTAIDYALRYKNNYDDNKDHNKIIVMLRETQVGRWMLNILLRFTAWLNFSKEMNAPQKIKFL